MLKYVVLNVWERNFVVTETVLEAVVMGVVELVVMVVTALEVLGKEFEGLAVG